MALLVSNIELGHIPYHEMTPDQQERVVTGNHAAILEAAIAHEPPNITVIAAIAGVMAVRISELRHNGWQQGEGFSLDRYLDIQQQAVEALGRYSNPTKH